jgi:hypothetical protein
VGHLHELNVGHAKVKQVALPDAPATAGSVSTPSCLMVADRSASFLMLLLRFIDFLR